MVRFATEGVKTIQLRVTNRGFRAPPGPISDIVRKPVNVLAASTPTIDDGPVGTVNTGDAKFAFSSPSSDIGFECSLDGGERAPCVSPVEFFGLSDGPHTFLVAAADGAEATRSWIVDTTAPKVVISAGPEGTTAARDATVEFSADDAEADFQCRLDSLEEFACTSPVELAGLADGPHAFAVRAVDGAGNVSEEATLGWTVAGSPAPGGDEGAPSGAGTGGEEPAGGAPAGALALPLAPLLVAQPPGLTLLAPSSVRLGARGAFALRARATHAGTLAATASVSSRIARSLGLGRRSVQIGTGRAVLAAARAGTTRVQLTPRARSAVRRQPSPIRVTVAATFTSTAGTAAGRAALLLLG